MARTFHVDIVTPDRTVYGGDVESLRAPAWEGELGVLAGHAPLLCALRAGEVRCRAGGGTQVFSVSGGFLEVSAGKAVVLADSAEAPESIDRARAERAATRARERLAKREKGLDVARAEAALARAGNRLRAAGRAGGE